MTNREKLNSECMYDLLCRMQSTLCSIYDLSEECSICVLDALGVQNLYVRCSKYNGIGNPERCKDCIAAWLNEEVK